MTDDVINDDSNEPASGSIVDSDLAAEQVAEEIDHDIEEAYLRAMHAVEEAGAWEEPPRPIGEFGSGEVATITDRDAALADTGNEQPATAVDSGAASHSGGPNLTPRQVLEALLFVGGEPLTTHKLCQLLRDEFTADFIEDQMEAMNARYDAERRPYRIAHEQGGYRLQIRSEFESVQRKVFGLGPREVRLSQPALEVLALVAYRQPISREDVEELAPSAAGPLRQLVRRELLCIERIEGSKQVRYRTTPRFLSLLGLRSLHDLPQADLFEFK